MRAFGFSTGALALGDFRRALLMLTAGLRPSLTGNEQHVVELLGEAAGRGWPIIVHPDAVQDWSLWRPLGDLLCLENMDKRKPIGAEWDIR